MRNKHANARIAFLWSSYVPKKWSKKPPIAQIGTNKKYSSPLKHPHSSNNGKIKIKLLVSKVVKHNESYKLGNILPVGMISAKSVSFYTTW